MSATVGTVMIDCNDIDAMAEFWTKALDLEVKVRYPSYIWLSRLSDGGPALALQKVPEARSGKNRIHLDLVAEDPEASKTTRCQAFIGQFWPTWKEMSSA